MRLTPWRAICLYIAADGALNVSFRTLQIYCTWYFVKLLSSEGALGSILVATSVTTLSLLPIWGVVLDRFKKSYILAVASVVIAFGAILSAWIAFEFERSSHQLMIGLALGSVLSSAGVAALVPLGTPLLPEITDREAEIHRGMRLKSAMFVVNLLLGPTLAGLAIERVGGNAALIVSIICAIFGLVFSLIFLASFNPSAITTNAPQNNSSLCQNLHAGARRVLKIKAERIIAVASFFANMLFIPFFFLILPAKLLWQGYGMLDLAFIELSLGAGVLLASGVVISLLRKCVTEHTLASFSITLIGITILMCAFTHELLPLCALNLLLGMGLTLFNITVNTKRAIAIPAGYRSTMESTMLFLCTAAVPFGFWVSKIVLIKFSPNQVILGGSEVFVVAIVLIVFSRPLRQMLNHDGGEAPYYLEINRELFE
ncbi:MFS transporter [Burkholderia plantarii]|uniref:MFS transporter n=1 Tax=Burkholderia plantarii TaxID=41899 RepID=UPI0018DD3736|nr:MFS transporter [Burkholderia plantarii]MBI0328726.1 MFS transporter [Burkholderia plantarii]